MFSKAYQIIIGVLSVALLALVIAYNIQGSKLDHVKAQLVSTELQKDLAMEGHKVCKDVVKSNNDAYDALKKEFAALKARGPIYIDKYTTVYRDLNEKDKNILDAELPAPVIRVLEDSSKN